MAYNSDGYIMIDFTEVDFRRTNQTIEGLYKRCVDVIGTNKFILVINANGRTPLPATCSFTNNQYVIDTCIYMFAISSNDNLFIRRNDVPASDIIDDDSISVDKTWSSNKINSELDTKADTSALEDYQPLLTQGDNIVINNNVISADLSAIIDDSSTSTTHTYSSNKIMTEIGNVVKSFTYTGNNNNPCTINFPTAPIVVLGITANVLGYENLCYTFTPNHLAVDLWIIAPTNPSGGLRRGCALNWVDSKTLEITGETGQRAFNSKGSTYTVYYI